MKVTVPVGVPPLDVTVAVKVTDCPKLDGFGNELTVVVDPARLTTCPPDNVPWLVVKLASPLYCAVIVCVPAASVEVTKVVMPLDNVPV